MENWATWTRQPMETCGMRSIRVEPRWIGIPGFNLNFHKLDYFKKKYKLSVLLWRFSEIDGSSNKKVTTFQKFKKLHFWSKVQFWQIFILLHKGSNAQQRVYSKTLKLGEITALNLSKIGKMTFFVNIFNFFLPQTGLQCTAKGIFIPKKLKLGVCWQNAFR